MTHVLSYDNINGNIYTRQKIKGSPVFSIKKVSILNGHNFVAERRTEIKKKSNLKSEVSTSRISEPIFLTSWKFEIMSHNNQSETFFMEKTGDPLIFAPSVPLAKTPLISIIQRSMISNRIILMAINGEICQGRKWSISG